MILQPLRRTLFGAGCALLVLYGCTSDGGRLPACDGRHKRPANPYGSILAGDATLSPKTSASGSPVDASTSASPPTAGASDGACRGTSP